MTGLVPAAMQHAARHGRACPGHPRLWNRL